MMRLAPCLALCAAVVASACADASSSGPGDGADVSSSPDGAAAGDAAVGGEEVASEDPVALDLNVLEHHPEQDAEEVQAGTVLWVDLSDEPSDAAILTVTDASGEAVAGTRTFIAPTRVAFEPDDLLRPDALYNVSVTWPGGAFSWSFTTGSAAYPETALSAGSMAFRVSPGLSETMNVVSPPNGGDFVRQIFPLQYFEITVVDPSTLTARIAIGDLVVQGDQQNFCQPTIDMEDITYTNPMMRTEPVDLPHYADLSQMPLGLTAVPVTFRGLQLQAALTASTTGGLSGFHEVSLWGTIDMREMAIGPCVSMAGFVPGMECVPCPGEPDVRECVSIWLTDLVGTLQPSMTLEALTTEDVEADPDCPL